MPKIRVYALLAIALAFLLAGCGTNPVTHKSELQLISESQEIAIGNKNYLPARQQQGGDYIADPQLTAYVQSVGDRLAAVSDRKLPYEFVVLNNSVPNAWAMPGGKIAVNRGLLYQLDSEAELAAVLGHEITHAAARHVAKSMETGMLLQGAVLIAGIAAKDNKYRELIVGGAQLSSALLATKFGRDEESEADFYGMHYMKKAGYDPLAAVTLQETFVRLSKDHKSGFIDGLFASHPPSEERVAANKATLAAIGAGGAWGREVYAQKVGRLKATRPAYQDYDAGEAALAKGDADKAASLARQAIRIEPREPRFQELLGDVAMAQKRDREALACYRRAIDMQPDYFRPFVQEGVVLKRLGREADAEASLKRGNALLPTAMGYYMLGQIAEDHGDVDTALKQYEIAAASSSEIGKTSQASLMRLDLPRNPGRYLQASIQTGFGGVPVAVVYNPTRLAVANVQISMERVDAATGLPLSFTRTPATSIPSDIAPGQSVQTMLPGVVPPAPNDLKYYRIIIESAELAR